MTEFEKQQEQQRQADKQSQAAALEAMKKRSKRFRGEGLPRGTSAEYAAAREIPGIKSSTTPGGIPSREYLEGVAAGIDYVFDRVLQFMPDGNDPGNPNILEARSYRKFVGRLLDGQLMEEFEENARWKW